MKRTCFTPLQISALISVFIYHTIISPQHRVSSSHPSDSSFGIQLKYHYQMKHAEVIIKLINTNKRNKIMWSFENINQNTPLFVQILQSLLITFRTKSSSPWSAKLCGGLWLPPSSTAVSASLCSSHAACLLFLQHVMHVPGLIIFSLAASSTWNKYFPRYLHKLLHAEFGSFVISPPPSIKNRLLHTLSLFLLLFHFIILITIWDPIIHSCLCILSFPWQK